MIHIHKIEQGTEEWFELRKGKLTGSNATPIGANGAGLKTYCKQIVIESMGIEKKQFGSSDIDRGNTLEPIALSAYEFEMGVKVNTAGFITNDKYGGVGVSPDGLVGDDGGIEIKARNDEKHFSLILGESKEIPYNQIQMTLLVTERKWWDFVSYNPNFSKPLFIKRILPDQTYFDKLLKGFETGSKIISEYQNKYENYVNFNLKSQ